MIQKSSIELLKKVQANGAVGNLKLFAVSCIAGMPSCPDICSLYINKGLYVTLAYPVSDGWHKFEVPSKIADILRVKLEAVVCRPI